MLKVVHFATVDHSDPVNVAVDCFLLGTFCFFVVKIGRDNLSSIEVIVHK